MDLLVALPPDLDLAAAELAVAWNLTPECTDIADARAVVSPESFIGVPSPGTTVVKLVGPFLKGLMINTVADLLVDLIADLQSRRGRPQPISTQQGSLPSGIPVIVVIPPGQE